MNMLRGTCIYLRNCAVIRFEILIRNEYQPIDWYILSLISPIPLINFLLRYMRTCTPVDCDSETCL